MARLAVQAQRQPLYAHDKTDARSGQIPTTFNQNTTNRGNAPQLKLRRNRRSVKEVNRMRKNQQPAHAAHFCRFLSCLQGLLRLFPSRPSLRAPTVHQSSFDLMKRQQPTAPIAELSSGDKCGRLFWSTRKVFNQQSTACLKTRASVKTFLRPGAVVNWWSCQDFLLRRSIVTYPRVAAHRGYPGIGSP